MLYLTAAGLFEECLEIGLALESLPPTFVRPTIEADTIVDLEDVSVLRCADLDLHLAPRTASWCLLDSSESAVAATMRATSFAALCAKHSDLPSDQIKEFCIRLYQRGLMRLDGEPGLHPEILQDGALFHEANLVEILITQKCNLACSYCLAEAGPDMPHLHPELAYRAVDEAFALRGDVPLAIQLSGGEPFVHFELFKSLVEYIERKSAATGRSVSIATQSNGTLINDDIAEFVKAHRIRMGISVDGPARLHDRARPLLGGHASHERTLRGIRTLQRHGIDFGTITVLNKHNVESPEEIADFFVQLGIKAVKINPINMIGDAQRTWNRLAISSEEYYRFLHRFITHVVDGRLPLQEANLGEYLKYLVRRIHNYRCMRSNCGAGRSFFLIDSRGDVYPCAHSAGIPEWKIGTIREAHGDLPDLGEQNPIVKQFQERRVDRLARAQTCPWRHFCEGGCAVNAYQQFGTILAPDTLCAFYERMYPCLFGMLSDEPERFQALLDLTLGVGQVTLVSFHPFAASDHENAVCPRGGDPATYRV